MPRKASADLTKPWKVNLPATLAGKIEFLLLDPVHQKPLYAARGFLLERLLISWLSRVEKPNGFDGLQRAVQDFLDLKISGEELRQALLADLALMRLPTLQEVRDAKS